MLASAHAGPDGERPAGIHLSDVPAMNYQRHLFREREIRCVTANTRDDAHEFLAAAGRQRIHLATHPDPLDAADRALGDLAHGRFAAPRCSFRAGSGHGWALSRYRLAHPA
ncbi:hypothetical protein IU432_16390 [Nocardia cyriacigeorgica]|nr:hypothetical protein [Nocardia cyriacigeorgica]MBF6434907.1 hypothetical protein [Nocardia cyriacigeorgica]MBF6455013.1 hypothetical protein [Nocardia cyriacigeorgica]MBF6479952.1 hypothetical protein [Nocardia cyriacigeorgica]MBF6552908.1 hypothetical protein [Nocardia cyriacigeorgica]